jgi:hypothetical protein
VEVASSSASTPRGADRVEEAVLEEFERIGERA